MLSSAPVLLLPPPSEPLVLLAARAIAVNLSSGEQITRRQLQSLLTDHFGGTDAEGRWTVRDAHVALELAQTACLLADAQISLTAPAAGADGMFAALESMAPAQTDRSEEQIEWQQFATPPRLAWLAARACALIPHELVLEPSAGTGMLAVWAAKAGTRLALNEISPLRRDCLSALFPDARLTGHDAELIDELLDPAIAPSVVLMNPPYSHGIERGHDTRTGARHLRSAWSRLTNGGRLVAIMPEWFDCPKFLAGLKGSVSLRLNAAIERAFIKQGTGITTRLLILDKVQSSVEPVAARTNDFAQLVDLVDALPGRAGIEDAPAQSGLPVRTPFRLVVSSRRPLSAPAKLIPATPMAIGPLTYRTLDAPAPIAPQVGHYLPFRPSRIIIDGASGHPTPLVESVAMGSISAPKPDSVPLLPDGLIAKGLLSAAQAETLIYAASAHARDLPGRFEPEDKGCSLKASAEGQVYRQGYFLGDGTGAGKGRQVASVILDRWVRGERRHIWISKNEALLEDARRDWAALGGLPIDIQPLASWKLGTPVAMRDGILFVTYPTLRSGRSDATRLDQILAWAGDDFDGVIVFDEAHAMANAAGGEGSRGKVKGSEQGIAGVRLQNLLPRARVLYASATGASDVNNLAYATRLGLWGPETAFANREAFVADIRDGGIAAMELVARDLKSLGLYTARALSFAGVEYEILEHCLTEDQIAVYDAYAQAWSIIHANLREALEATCKLEAVSLGRFQELTGLQIEAPDGSMVDDLPSIQRWLNRILALPIARQNAIFDEFMGLVEARIDAARQAGTLDLGLETIAVEDFTILSDTLLRTDPASGATTHLLELEIARALKPLTLKRLEELYGLTGQRQRPVRNARSGRVALLVPARSILADDGTRVARFEMLRPLKRSHITEDQLAESSWEGISVAAFREAWAAEVEEARTSHKRERVYLATGLLLPVWDKLPSDFVRVSRISAADGRSLLGREVPADCVPELCRALGLEREQTLSADEIVQTVLATGRAMEFTSREQLMVKRSLVNGSQRIELAGWSAARLDWYKAQGCFTEIIRYQTRLFVPIDNAASVIARLASST